MSLTLPLLDSAGVLLVAYLIKRLLFDKRSQGTLPPGPTGWPIIGNLLDWPALNEWGAFSWKARAYGDITHFDVMGTHMIVLNSVDAAIAMLQRKGANYSDRPDFYFANKLAGGGEAAPSLDDGPRLKETRRIFAQEIGSKAALEKYAFVKQERVRDFLKKLLDDPSPERLHSHIRGLTASIILDLTYGYEVKEGGDDLVDLVEKVMEEFGEHLTPGAHLVDTFNWLAKLPSWVPGTHFHKEAVYMKGRLMDMINIPFNYAKQQTEAGLARTSFIGSQLESGKLSAEQEHILKWAGQGFYTGGADTSVSVIYSLFLYMTLYPEIQAKAQAEIDAVVGNTRLPTLADRADLPYVNAVIDEVLRYGDIVPQGVPHRVRADDVHEGYLIPKDSWVIANIWFMSRDPRTYKNPEQFDPTRFLGDQPELDPRTYIFGFGRRICPGRHFADNNVFLACVMVLATMDVSKAMDEDGKEITPVVEYHGGVVTHPREFACKITPRSAQAEVLIKSKSVV